MEPSGMPSCHENNPIINAAQAKKFDSILACQFSSGEFGN
jgi:hypothetical protein